MSTVIVYTLIGNELRVFAELNDVIEHYPMLIVKDKLGELKNVRQHWMVIPETVTTSNVELMDVRSEIRKIDNIEDVIRTATRFTNWEEFDKAKKEEAMDSIQVKYANCSSQLADTEQFLDKLISALRSAEIVNTTGGPGSRKTVTDILDKSILEVAQVKKDINLLLEAL